MITGTHVMFFSKDADADRAFLRDVLEFPHIDAGGGWLIFALPPADAGVHPSEKNDVHEVYFVTDNLEAEMVRLKEKGVACDAPSQQSWGIATRIALPGGGKLGLYEPLAPHGALIVRDKARVIPGERSETRNPGIAERGCCPWVPDDASRLRNDESCVFVVRCYL